MFILSSNKAKAIVVWPGFDSASSALKSLVSPPVRSLPEAETELFGEATVLGDAVEIAG